MLYNLVIQHLYNLRLTGAGTAAQVMQLVLRLPEQLLFLLRFRQKASRFSWRTLQPELMMQLKSRCPNLGQTRRAYKARLNADATAFVSSNASVRAFFACALPFPLSALAGDAAGAVESASKSAIKDCSWRHFESVSSFKNCVITQFLSAVAAATGIYLISSSI